MRSERLARKLLRLYPRTWRERYGEEFLSLLTESPLTLRVLLDVCAAAFVERGRASLRWNAVRTGPRSTAEFAFVVFASWKLSTLSRDVAWHLATFSQSVVAPSGLSAREAMPLLDEAAMVVCAVLMVLCVARAWRGNFPYGAPARPLSLPPVVLVYVGLFLIFTLARFSDLISADMHPWESSARFAPPPLLGPLFLLHQGWRRTRYSAPPFAVW